jgi:RNA polymerase sigma factor (sigma-70 family)
MIEDRLPLLRLPKSTTLVVDRLLEQATSIRNRIVRGNMRLVLSLARRHVDRRLSFDDLLGEAHASLIHAVDKFDVSRGNKFSTYAVRSAANNLNHFANRYRRQNKYFAGGESETLASTPDSRSAGDVDERRRLDCIEKVREMLRRLDDEKRCVLMARFGLVDENLSNSLKNLGRRMGLSRDRVRRLQAGALNALRRMAEQSGLELPD